MHICYVDESGCTGVLPSATSDVQPVLVLTGVFVEQSLLRDLTRQFVQLKKQFFPHAPMPDGRRPQRSIDWILVEVKGTDVRKNLRSKSRNTRRHAQVFLNRFLSMLEYFDINLVSRIWVKGINAPMDGRAVYTSSIQAICGSFQHFLTFKNDSGIIIADSRTKPQNATVSHSIFTKKFKGTGDDHPRILEMPTFGHSENHAGIQIADLICSAFLFPVVCFCYCTGYVQSTHVRPEFKVIKDKYMGRLKALQYRYQDELGRFRGGLTICDGLAQRNGAALFR